MSLDTRQSWDWLFWMVLLAIGGFVVIGWSILKPFIFPIFIIVLIDLYLLIVNNSIAIKEIKAKERKSPKDDP